MPDQELDQLYEQLRAKQSSDPAFAAYLASMDALYAEIKALYRPDAQGLPPLVDAARLSVLRDKYREAAKAVDAYLKGQDEAQLSEEKREERKLAQRINGLMSHDMSVLLQYENRMQRQIQLNQTPALESLPTLIEKSRAFTVDMSKAKISTVGGVMSQRIPMEITVNGVKMRGMFTKKNSLDCAADFKEVVGEAASRCTDPTAKGGVGDLLKLYRDYYPKLNEGIRAQLPLKNDDRQDILSFTSLLYAMEDKNKGMGKQLLADVLGAPMNLTAEKHLSAIIKLHGGANNFAALLGKLVDLGGKHGTHDSAGIEQTARLDDRNAAMSKVAALLGVPEIICNAVPMRYKDENGKLVEGTFMEMANGVDCTRPKGLSASPNEYVALESPRVLRDLSNLQMLDYLCGNIDRHSGNMIFTFAGKNMPVTTGVKGIDNDMSFGAKLFEKGKSHMPPLEKMRVVSESMAQRIEALTPAQLKFALREFSLSEKELDAAGQRLERVQAMLVLSREKYKNHKPVAASARNFYPDVIRIVPDRDFDRLDAQSLCSTSGTSLISKVAKGALAVQNIFNKAMLNIKRICNAMAYGTSKTAPLAEVTSANRATKESAEAQRKAADVFAKGMKKALGAEPDEEAKKLSESVTRYQRYQTSLCERLKLDPDDPNNCFDAVIGANDLFRMTQLLGELNQSANAYLERDNVPDNALKKLAEEIQTYSAKLKSVPPEIEAEEKQTVMANDRQAMERFNRGMAEKFRSAAKPADGAPS